MRAKPKSRWLLQSFENVQTIVEILRKKTMLGMCPECKLAHPIDSDDRMMDHKDPHGTFPCGGIGEDCGVVLKNEPKRKIDRSFDREMGDDDSPDSSCGVVGLPVAKEAFQFVPVSVKSKPGLFGSIGDQIKVNLKKLSQKERKAKK